MVVDLGIPRVSCASFDDWLPKSKLGDMSHDVFISEREDPSPGRQFLGDLKEITQEHANRVFMEVGVNGLPSHSRPVQR